MPALSPKPILHVYAWIGGLVLGRASPADLPGYSLKEAFLLFASALVLTFLWASHVSGLGAGHALLWVFVDPLAAGLALCVILLYKGLSNRIAQMIAGLAFLSLGIVLIKALLSFAAGSVMDAQILLLSYLILDIAYLVGLVRLAQRSGCF